MISACPLVIPVFPSVVGRVERSATRHLFRPAAAWRVTLRFTRPTIYPDAMPDYRRNRVPGATYFFTTNLRDRRSGLLVTQIEALREAVRGVRRQLPFRIDAWVVLPDHMHCLWTLPEGDSDFPERWRGSRLHSRERCRIRGDQRSSPAKASAVFGSAAIGSTRSVTTATTPPTWITSTSIQ
jgi:REP element-mobilizing transposase RayT